ncbi:hypothetical protein evm_013377 [Chilo suppressalis]|nr:hypothetical protein evm_013377 [Chilo suppressalis]
MANLNSFDEPNTFKHYYFPLSESEGSCETSILKNKTLKRTASNASINEFFDEAKPKKTQKKTSSTVGRAQKCGNTAYISTNMDDAAGSTHLIKIEVYDLRKLAKIPNSEHWKHADVCVKYYSKDSDKNYNQNKELIYSITKDIANIKDCKKYFFKNSSFP